MDWSGKSMNKRNLLDSILNLLQQELDLVTRSAQVAHEEATHSESVAEDRHDTRGLEASYLAGAQAARASEIQRLILVFKFLHLPEYRPGDLIGPGALVELDLKGHRSFYFLVPQGGGLTLQQEGKPVRVITPQAPLGEALLGQALGSTVEVEGGSLTREYKIVGIS
jgi:transcription elongation GreA/GreB family factor